jgi:uncharacterized protein YdiU (UPF0061 family)
LFWALVSEYDELYNHKMSQPQKKQVGLVKSAQQQIAIVKLILKSINRTINDTSKSELILGNGLQDVKEFINEQNVAIKQKYIHTLIWWH